ncbi:carbamoyl phosphate synthase [Anopheles sinensis]|uniref:Carbamoyl phosphate synthase n=1 Tax=Anopheles sinensis TaxID=74873 RepID=A0A084WRW3_ANOSI|nr:carbamoyl phosphate synthase [Anopheles sinensis]
MTLKRCASLVPVYDSDLGEPLLRNLADGLNVYSLRYGHRGDFSREVIGEAIEGRKEPFT